MKLTRAQLDSYDRDGFVLVEGALSNAAIDQLDAALPALFDEDSPRRVLEVDNTTVRSVYGCHQTSDLFRSLTCHPSLLEPAMQLANHDVYVYQLKVNAKRARSGDVWAWHQDLIYWIEEDGLAGADIVNVALFLDDVTADNGAMQAIPGSHRLGVIAAQPRDERAAYEDKPPWIADLIAAIKYTIDDRTIARLVGRLGVAALEGPRGSALIFHPNLVHASPRNRSPRDRKVLVATYNSTANRPRPPGEPRPEFLVSRDFTPLRAIDDPRLA